ncbi:MAG: DUF2007 domain-containing protein [bacterium]|nr:DUF2007 domain-containing protein [bacterium]
MTDSRQPNVLCSFDTEFEASAVAAALNDNGMEARVVGGFTSGFKAEAPGLASIVVHESDLAHAKKMLEQIKRENDDIDWSKVDVGQPE